MQTAIKVKSKNLFDKTEALKISNWVFTSGGNSQYTIEVEPNTEYTYHYDIQYVIDHPISGDVIFNIGNGTENKPLWHSSNVSHRNATQTITSSSDGKLYLIEYGVSQDKLDGLLLNTSVMLNEGSTALPYEPYGDRLIPVTPARVHKSRNLCPLFLGRSTEVLNVTYTHTDKVYVDFTKLYYMAGSGYILPPAAEDTFQISNGTISLHVSIGWYGIAIPISVKPLTTYSISGIRDNDNGRLVYALYKNDGTFSRYYQISGTVGVAEFSTYITTREDETILFVVFTSANVTVSPDIVISNVMVNEGSTALPYEPYGDKIVSLFSGRVKDSKNLFDKVSMGSSTGVSLANSYGADKIWYNGNNSKTVVIPVKPNTHYVVTFLGGSVGGNIFRAATTKSLVTSGYDESNPYTANVVVRKTSAEPISINSGNDGQYLYVQCAQSYFSQTLEAIMVSEGSTIPTEYEPYGKKII